MDRATTMLLECLGKESAETVTQSLRDYREEEWEALLDTASLHSVVPILFHKLKPHHNELNVPKRVWEKMHGQFLNSAARNMRLYHELQNILSRLKSEDIPVIVLKGAHLAASVYSNIALRTMCDVDLLVRKEDLQKVEDVLLKAGGVPKQCNRVVTDSNINFTYTLLPDKLVFEIHWELFYPTFPSQINLVDIWNRAIPVQFEQTDALTLSPEDNLIYLCAHAAKHIHNLIIRMLYDIKVLLQQQEHTLDWQIIYDRARDWGLIRTVYIMLMLVQEFPGFTVTPEHLNAFRPNQLNQFDEAKYSFIRKQLLEKDMHDEIFNSMQDRPFFSGLWALKGLRKKAAYITNRIFLPLDDMALEYPAPARSWRIYLYYPLRLKQMVERHNKTFLMMALQDSNTVTAAKKVNEVNLLREWLLSE